MVCDNEKMMLYNEKIIQWNKKKYNLVILELKYLFCVSLIKNENIFHLIKKEKGDYRRYFISEHYYNFKKCVPFFIDLEHKISMQMDRNYIKFESEHQTYISKIVSSYFTMLKNHSKYKVL